MKGLNMMTTEDASGFSSLEWEEWDAFLNGFGESCIHLTSPAVRAALRSPQRAVRAARWLDGNGGIQGIAICEDSEAQSQRIDDFLEGNAWFSWAKSWLHRRGGFRFGVRVVGSPLASGPYGYRFAEGVDEWSSLTELLDLPGIPLPEDPQPSIPKTWVVKDRPCTSNWGDGTRHAGRSGWHKGWVDLEFDPVMHVSLTGRSSWEAYMSGMRTKARTKVKRILTLSQQVEFVSMDMTDIQREKDTLHRLYMNVFGRAAFKLGCLQPEDLVLLKEEMGEAFQVWVAKLEGETIGFHCGMNDGRSVEAFFVGFENGANKTYALYQRMLVEFIRWGIETGCDKVSLGRTALDMKASLGAEPQRLVLHERIQNPVMHGLARWAARASAPRQSLLKRAWKEDAMGQEPASVHHEVVAAS